MVIWQRIFQIFYEEENDLLVAKQRCCILLDCPNWWRCDICDVASTEDIYSNNHSSVDSLHGTAPTDERIASFETKSLSYRGQDFSREFKVPEELADAASRYLLGRISECWSFVPLGDLFFLPKVWVFLEGSLDYTQLCPDPWKSLPALKGMVLPCGWW